MVPPFLAGGGETGALIRAFDWTTTTLGPVEAWPASLKTTVGTLLHSRQPMFLWWGPELIQFYNDAYLPSFGRGKHPAAMGQRGADCWQEIWPVIWPQIDGVMRHGRSTWNEDHLGPILRNGRLEEVFWTYGYSPVFDEGGIAGTLVVCTETTNRVLAERRLDLVRRLAEAMALATDTAGVFAGAAGVFATAGRDIAFALLYALDHHEAGPRLIRTVGTTEQVSAAIGGHLRHQLATLAADGQTIAMPSDITVVGTGWPEPVTELFAVPIGPSALAQTKGVVLVGLSPRLPFDAAYRACLHQLGQQIGQAHARFAALRARAAAEAERNHLLEQAPVATALLEGPDHVFRLANPLYRQLVGRSDIIGRSYLEAFPELRDTPLPAILDRVYRAGQPFVSDEMRIPLVRGGTRDECFVKFNLEPMRDAAGQVSGIMAVAVDITAQVAARRSLEQGQVEREKLLRDLQSASRAKDEFLAMLGHELRNPLSPILTALQLMRLRGVRGAEKEREVIERQVKHVVGLVDDLLDVSRITRGMLELKRERVRIADVIAKAIEQASPLIEQRRHRLTVDADGDLYVDGDSNRLAQVVSNLLTNAAKYTEPGGAIDVRAGREDGVVRLRVRDNGIGIRPDVVSHLFDAFTQERQRSDRSQGGLGLGLAIVKSLVDAHGGVVTLHSEGPGTGTECVVQLPMAGSAAPARATEPPRTAKPEQGGCRILIVDDNEDAAQLLAESLGAMGHHVEVAFDGPGALDLAARYVPDVAVLDLGLPVIDGYELAARLRVKKGWRHVRFAALTGYGQQVDRALTKLAGFDVHLVKPIDLQELDRTIRQLPGSPDKIE